MPAAAVSSCAVSASGVTFGPAPSSVRCSRGAACPLCTCTQGASSHPRRLKDPRGIVRQALLCRERRQHSITRQISSRPWSICGSGGHHCRRHLKLPLPSPPPRLGDWAAARCALCGCFAPIARRVPCERPSWKRCTGPARCWRHRHRAARGLAE